MSNLALNLADTGRCIPAHQATVTDAAYKYPRCIWLVDSLPTGPTGKLLRRDVTPPLEEV